MKSRTLVSPSSRRRGWNLALAIVIGACVAAGSTAVDAQSTTGTVFGKAPTGYAVAVHSNTTGTTRTVHVSSRGRYSIRELPVGVYSVTLENSGNAVAKHLNVPVVVGRGIQVDFDCAKIHCPEVVGKE
ncbi:carboxypeptidase-like regulatory domain-containing protein [Fulvimonas sp. R45]|uniref:carboxypeptidase-like regulatory domain-containing protein n=1 Tax=Fulvimonas sp. R45 TaxID=3045937 RepID=UPI00265FD673|nr:carboxypeptidase-like regulatory domain-containing protein [Fulvimonas sp. R45]MDO1528552.1 carboxypeptidase-like regulatory domain-containing protein [Fulvimonas sp. R45]